MGQTRDIQLTPKPLPKPPPTPSGLHNRGAIANGLRESWEVCNASTRTIEDYLPEELRSFDTLLGPLIRCKDETATALKQWTQRSSAMSSDGSDAQRANKSTRTLPSISTSSRNKVFSTGALVMDARELCRVWAGCATNHFQLSSFQWFRDTVGARHEYLIFKLESGKSLGRSRKDLWLRLERRPSASASVSVREGVRVSKRRLMGSLLGQFVADDLITISPRREDLLQLEDAPLEPQASVVFSEKPPLRYLVDVLDIIHKESLEYHIAGANCWFYASTVAEIMTKKARAVWERGDISYCDHWKSKHMVNSDQYTRIMNRVRYLREYYS